MAKIISIANTKGGTGKSTVTILLASALAIEDKKRVLVLDCDNQESISDLRELELAPNTEAPYPVESIQPKFVHDFIKRNIDNYDYIFIDLPRITSNEQTDSFYGLIVRCDFIFVPIIARHLDTAATIKFIDGINEIKAYKKEQKTSFGVYGFLSRKERRKSNDIVLQLMQENGLDILKKSIPKLAFFEDISTIESPFNSNEGVLRFKPFYNEFKSKIS